LTIDARGGVGVVVAQSTTRQVYADYALNRASGDVVGIGVTNVGVGILLTHANAETVMPATSACLVPIAVASDAETNDIYCGSLADSSIVVFRAASTTAVTPGNCISTTAHGAVAYRGVAYQACANPQAALSIQAVNAASSSSMATTIDCPSAGAPLLDTRTNKLVVACGHGGDITMIDLSTRVVTQVPTASLISIE
jgi:hypothetical protein